MKIILFILSSLQILCCSGQPCGNCTFPVIDEALIASVRKLNDISSIDNLFAMVKGEVKDIVSVGERMFFVDLALDVQETVCPKDSGLDWADCALKPLATAETANCTSRVTFDIDVVVNVEVQCTEMDWITPKPRPIPDSESSSESNESSDESSSEKTEYAQKARKRQEEWQKLELQERKEEIQFKKIEEWMKIWRERK